MSIQSASVTDQRYKGIFYMLLASLGFAVMGGAAKTLTGILNAGQLVFFRNLLGFLFLVISFAKRPPENKGGKFHLLIFRGIIGTVALYGLLYCILNMPLGTAMSYNLSSAIFIALFSFLLFKEFNGYFILIALLLGFSGMLLIYKPHMDLAWQYHLAGIISGIASAIAYLTVGRLSAYYDTRIIVLSFLLGGIFLPLISFSLHHAGGLREDGLFIIAWKWPNGWQWFNVSLLALSALFGQYFVTRAYAADRAGIVSAVSYVNILFSVFIGVLLGDAIPDPLSWLGITLIITGGIIVSIYKRKK